MNDPHVVSVHYRLKPVDNLTYNNPPPVESNQPDFDFRLADGAITFTMHRHCATEQEAREIADSYLQLYKLGAVLALGRCEFVIAYDHSNIEDRDPPPVSPPGAAQCIIIVGSGGIRLGGGTAIVSFGRAQYPDAPAGIALSPDVESMWQRYEGWQAGREPLPAMAYFCLTVVEAALGSRHGAAKRLNIDFKVLDTLGQLSSAVGDDKTGRKRRVQQHRAHTDAENTWMDNAVRALIRRMAEYAADPTATRPLLTLPLP